MQYESEHKFQCEISTTGRHQVIQMAKQLFSLSNCKRLSASDAGQSGMSCQSTASFLSHLRDYQRDISGTKDF